LSALKNHPFFILLRPGEEGLLESAYGLTGNVDDTELD
jgi:hypothetical protein